MHSELVLSKNSDSERTDSIPKPEGFNIMCDLAYPSCVDVMRKDGKWLILSGELHGPYVCYHPKDVLYCDFVAEVARRTRQCGAVFTHLIEYDIDDERSFGNFEIKRKTPNANAASLDSISPGRMRTLQKQLSAMVKAGILAKNECLNADVRALLRPPKPKHVHTSEYLDKVFEIYKFWTGYDFKKYSRSKHSRSKHSRSKTAPIGLTDSAASRDWRDTNDGAIDCDPKVRTVILRKMRANFRKQLKLENGELTRIQRIMLMALLFDYAIVSKISMSTDDASVTMLYAGMAHTANTFNVLIQCGYKHVEQYEARYLKSKDIYLSVVPGVDISVKF